jgi:O6-methylguanine-DNA--protein-cysteine methyltransferase
MKRAPAPLHTDDGPRAAPYAAKLRTPFAVLASHRERKLTGSTTCREQAGAATRGRLHRRGVAEIGRYSDPQHRFALPLDPGGRVPAPRLAGDRPHPVGESRTYGEIARALHRPRAVGNACAPTRSRW